MRLQDAIATILRRARTAPDHDTIDLITAQLADLLSRDTRFDRESFIRATHTGGSNSA